MQARFLYGSTSGAKFRAGWNNYICHRKLEDVARDRKAWPSMLPQLLPQPQALPHTDMDIILIYMLYTALNIMELFYIRSIKYIIC